MSRTSPVSRAAIAVVAIAVAVVLAIWVATYRVEDMVHNPSPNFIHHYIGSVPTHSPGWAVPVATLIGVAGLGFAALVLRHR